MHCVVLLWDDERRRGPLKWWLSLQYSYCYQAVNLIRVALCIHGIGYGLPWYGLSLSFHSKETGGNFQSPSVLSESSLNLRSNASSELQCGVLRWAQLFLTMLGRFALSYLASRSTTRLVALRVLAGSWAKLKLSLSALEMLGLSCRLLIFLMGWRTSSMVMVFSFKSNTASISCKVYLPMIKSYNGCGLPWGYSIIPGHRCTFLLAEYSTKESSTHPPSLFWRCWWKCSMTLEQPFLQRVCTYQILFLRKGGPHLILCQGGPW